MDLGLMGGLLMHARWSCGQLNLNFTARNIPGDSLMRRLKWRSDLDHGEGSLDHGSVGSGRDETAEGESTYSSLSTYIMQPA
jgi:hypothetical protein